MNGKLFKSTGTIRVRIEPGPTPSDSTNGDDKDGSPSQWAHAGARSYQGPRRPGLVSHLQELQRRDRARHRFSPDYC